MSVIIVIAELQTSTSMVLDSTPMIGRAGNFYDSLKTLEPLRHHGFRPVTKHRYSAIAIVFLS